MTKKAEDQLDAIIDYVVVQLENPLAATSVFSDYLLSINRLKDHPLAFAYVNDDGLRRRGYRKIKFERHDYILLFTIENDVVNVTGVFHTQQNYINRI